MYTALFGLEIRIEGQFVSHIRWYSITKNNLMFKNRTTYIGVSAHRHSSVCVRVSAYGSVCPRMFAPDSVCPRMFAP